MLSKDVSTTSLWLKLSQHKKTMRQQTGADWDQRSLTATSSTQKKSGTEQQTSKDCRWKSKANSRAYCTATTKSFQTYQVMLAGMLAADLPAFTINTEGARPTAAKPYSSTGILTKAELKNMEELGIIEDSTSPWSSPVICVPKPGGGLRLCMDYRKLNSATTTDVYPLPNIEHLVQRIAQSRFITTLDLTKGYYQIPLDQGSKEKTAFVTAFGKWQFSKMPFGVKNARMVPEADGQPLQEPQQH